MSSSWMSRARRLGLGVALGLSLLGGGAARADTLLRVRNGSPVRVLLDGVRERGVGVRPGEGGWRVELGARADQTAELVDVTEGSHDRWLLEPRAGGALFLDDARFIPGHAYRVTLKRGTTSFGSALVYLYPPSAAARRRLRFTDRDAKAASASDDMDAAPKPQL